MFEPEDDEEIPYEFADQDAFLRDWYGADSDEELYDAIESDDYDYDDQEVVMNCECPNCGSDDAYFDSFGGQYKCPQCDYVWGKGYGCYYTCFRRTNISK